MSKLKENLLNEGNEVLDFVKELDQPEYLHIHDAYYQASDGIKEMEEALDILPKSEQKLWEQMSKLLRKSQLGKYM